MSLILSHPLVLLIIPVIMIVWYIFGRERIGTIHPNPLIARHLKTPKIIWGLWFLRLLIISGLIGIIAGVSVIQEVTTRERSSQDIMIVFDLSLSMLAEDISPSRISVARDVVKQFIRSRDRDQIGLIVFAGKPFVSVPFSTDRSGLSHIVTGLSPYLIHQDLPGLSGTNIGDALLLANMTHHENTKARVPQKQEVQGREIFSTRAYKAVSEGENNFSNEEIRGFSGTLRRSIILITDGKANIGIDPMIAAEESAKQEIQIYPIGIGSLSGVELSYTDRSGVKQYFSDGSGGHLRSDLDEPMMRELARTTGGKYFHADDRLGLQTVFGQVDSELGGTLIEKTEIKNTDISLYLLIGVIIGIIVERWWISWILRRYRLR